MVKAPKVPACNWHTPCENDVTYERVLPAAIVPYRQQLLKWVGSKQKVAHLIIAAFPAHGAYHEPFLGAGGVMATLAPPQGHGADAFAPLIAIWQTLSRDPETLVRWYADRWHRFQAGDRVAIYEDIKASYNAAPNGADFLFLTRACYGGIVRFRRKDGYMSTPVGVHPPIPPDAFAKRVTEWHRRLAGCDFACMDFAESIARAKPGDLVYCDPPYVHTQTILYGAQAFDLKRLFAVIADAATRGVHVALSIDGHSKSGDRNLAVPVPDGLFQRDIAIPLGRSMLRRFQMGGQSMEGEGVSDRLLLTF
jgi:DNA adenine methylase